MDHGCSVAIATTVCFLMDKLILMDETYKITVKYVYFLYTLGVALQETITLYVIVPIVGASNNVH